MEIIGHVHDEIIGEYLLSKEKEYDMKGAMSQLPEWAEGLPLDADGFKTMRYRKE